MHGASIRALTDTTVPETEFPDPYNLGTALLVLRMQYTQDRHEIYEHHAPSKGAASDRSGEQASAARSNRVKLNGIHFQSPLWRAGVYTPCLSLRHFAAWHVITHVELSADHG